MKAKLTTCDVHGRDIVGVAGGVVDQEHGEGTLEVAGRTAAIYRQEMMSKLVHNSKM